MKSYLNIVSAFVALVSLLAFGITLFGKSAELNIATWVAWGVLNSMLAWNQWRTKGAWKLALGCTVGVWLIAAMTLREGSWSLGFVEVVCLLGTALSAYVWRVQGPRIATIALVTAMNVAGIPTVLGALADPNPDTWWLWGGLTIACFLALIGAKSWSVEERLYPGVQLVFNGLMTALVLN